MKSKITPSKLCACCGIQMTPKTYPSGVQCVASFKLRKYCSRACFGKSTQGFRVQNEHAGRHQARKQNKGYCEQCGVTKSEQVLSVHHDDENPLNNDPSNLITLCQKCHRGIHAKRTRHERQYSKKCKHCDRFARKVGLCPGHYSRLRNNGDPLMVKTRGGLVFFTAEFGTTFKKHEVSLSA